jgi:hypothetical protein
MLLRKIIAIYFVNRMEILTMRGQNVLVHTETTKF